MRVSLSLVVAAVSIVIPSYASSCSGTVNPSGDFLSNFNKPCYSVTMTTGGGLNEAGDPDATYDQIYYQIQPGYELVVLGTFPNARFLSASAYDSHLVTTATMLDQNILPMKSSMTNPFAVGGTYVPNQTYGLTISYGGTLTKTPTKGCSAADTTIDKNVLNASQIHQGLTWNGYPNLPPGFPVHQTGANTSGIVMIRKYMDLSKTASETVIVRSLSTGCALLASQAIALNLVSVNQSVTSPWLNQPQLSAHRQFSKSIESTMCYPPDPNNSLQWFRQADYQSIGNSSSDDIYSTISTTQLQGLIAGGNFIQIQFPFPVVPNIPCTSGSCSLTGNENLRYFSVTVEGPPGTSNRLTLAATSDPNFIRDANGNVTLVIGLGAAPPPTLTAANGYTYMDLTGNPNLTQLEEIYIRNILPSPQFLCSNGNVPFFTMEYNPEGGFMGANVPTLTFPTASQISAVPPPLPARPDSCALIPPPPQSCI